MTMKTIKAIETIDTSSLQRIHGGVVDSGDGRGCIPLPFPRPRPPLDQGGPLGPDGTIPGWPLLGTGSPGGR
jgi:hypothetical protein